MLFYAGGPGLGLDSYDNAGDTIALTYCSTQLVCLPACVIAICSGSGLEK